ncbi:hypothetical protein [Ottowia sp.]|uniref:hypothetical protein n=1 Tax=Ottowia sp. TaxID=1898956 RepID=UPI003A8A8CB0
MTRRHCVAERTPRFTISAIGLAIGLLAAPAWAINGSGTFAGTGVATALPSTDPAVGTLTTVTGTFTTPQGDTGTFTLERTAVGGHPGNPEFFTNGTGITAANATCGIRPNATGCTTTHPPPGHFTYQLTLVPDLPNAGLLTEVVQGAVDGSLPTGNSDIARMVLGFSGAAPVSGTPSSGVLAANPDVEMKDANGTAIGGLVIPQVRDPLLPSCPNPIVRNVTPAANCDPLAASTTLASGDEVQIYGVANDLSQYRFDFPYATTVTVGLTGNQQGNWQNPTSTVVGFTYREWIGFGVRSLPVAVDDSYSAINTASVTTTAVLANDYVGGVLPVAPNYSITPGAAPAPAAGSITMAADGTVTIAAGTTPGTYAYAYELCDVRAASAPAACVTATATIVVTAGSTPAGAGVTAVPVGSWWLLLPPVLVAGGWSARRQKRRFAAR